MPGDHVDEVVAELREVGGLPVVVPTVDDGRIERALAIRDDRIQLDGSPSLIREFPTWNARSMFAHIRPVSRPAATSQAKIRQHSFA